MKEIDLNKIYTWPPAMWYGAMALMFFLVIFLGYFFDISSLRSKITNIQQQEADQKQQLEMVIDKNARLTAELSHFAQLETILNQWRGKLIKSTELTELLNEILKTGGNDQLFFSLLNPGKEVKADSFFKIPIKLIVVGSYKQIATFISQIANLPKIVVVGNFTISNEYKNEVIGSKLAEKAAAQNLLTAELALEVYRLAETKPK